MTNNWDLEIKVLKGVVSDMERVSANDEDRFLDEIVSIKNIIKEMESKLKEVNNE